MKRWPITVELILASLFVNLLGLALPLYVIQAFTRYLANGLDETLYALTFGTICAIFFELFFKSYRLRALVDRDSINQSIESLFNDIRGLDFFSPVLREIKFFNSQFNQAKEHSLKLNIKARLQTLDLPFVSIYILVIYLISPIACLVFISTIFLGMLVTVVYRRKSQRLTRLIHSSKMEQDNAQAELINRFTTVRLFGQYPNSITNWKEQECKHQKLNADLEINGHFQQSFSQFLLAITICLTVFTSAIEVANGNLEISALIALNILIARAFGPIVNLPELISVFQFSGPALDIKIAKERAGINESSGVLEDYRGQIDLIDLTFEYPGQRRALFEKFTFKFLPGTTTVITGSNGAGKTTLFNLISGQLRPLEGLISVGGVNLNQIDQYWWSKRLIAVDQEPEFLDGTIESNLLAVKDGLTSEEILSSLEYVGLTNFLYQSSDGLNTEVGNDRKVFNLGFRKRLALARASLVDGNVVLMDEPTEGVDLLGAKIFYQFLNEQIANGKTSIILSHDPAIIKGADTVIDLDNITSASK